MTGTQRIKSGDIVHNPFRPSAVLERYGKFYAINHYPSGLTHERDEYGTRIYRDERYEIRYELKRNNIPV